MNNKLFKYKLVKELAGFLSKGSHGGVLKYDSTAVAISRGCSVLALCIVFALLGIFSTQAGAQSVENTVKISSFYDAGAFDDDGVTKLISGRGAGLEFRLCTPYVDGATHELEIIDPSGDTNTYNSSRSVSGGECSFSSIPVFQVTDLFGSRQSPNEGSYRIRGRASDSANWGPYYYVALDHTAPTLNVYVSAADAGAARITAAANAYDLGSSMHKFEVVNGHTGTCDASGTSNATFEDYAVTQLTVEANTAYCFRATDLAGNVAYGSTDSDSAIVGITGPPETQVISSISNPFTNGFHQLFTNNNIPSTRSTWNTNPIAVHSAPGGTTSSTIVYLTKPDKTTVRMKSLRATENVNYDLRGSAFNQSGTYTLFVTEVASDGGLESAGSPVNLVIEDSAPVIDIRLSLGGSTGERLVTATATSVHDRIRFFGIRIPFAGGGCSSSKSSYSAYKPGTVVSASSGALVDGKCFYVDTSAGTRVFTRSTSGKVLGNTSADVANNNYVGAISYLNGDGSASAPGNFLNDLVEIKTIMVPNTAYRLYVRPVGGSWPAASSSITGTSTSVGLVETKEFIPPNDGTYEVAFQIQELDSSTYLPAYSDLTSLSTFAVDTVNPVVIVTETSGKPNTENRVYTAAATDAGDVSLEVATNVARSSCTADDIGNTTFSSYTEGNDHDVNADQHSCFRATDEANNVVYVSTASVAGIGINFITYRNSDNTVALDNSLKSRTFTVGAGTTPNTEYRLFVRIAGSDGWSSTPTTSGTSNSVGLVTSRSITLAANGDYELAAQVKVGDTYLPDTLTVDSEFTIDGSSVPGGGPTPGNGSTPGGGPTPGDNSAPSFTLGYAGTPTVVNNVAYYNTATLTSGGVTVSNIVEANLATATLTLTRTDTTGVSDLTSTATIGASTVSFANLTSVPTGAYTASVTLTDGATNATTETLNLVVDTVTPNITGITIADPSARGSVEATIAVTHGQTVQETLTARLSGQNCSNLNTITITGSGNTTTDVDLRGQTGTFTCTITLADQAGNTSNSFTIPTFTIERSSSGGGGSSRGGGGGGGVSPGTSGSAPTFGTGTPSTETPAVPPSTPTQPTQSTQPTQVAQPPIPTQPTVQPPTPIQPTLSRGSQGERVRTLQQFLNRDGYTVAVTGPGSAGQETTYFGPATERALRAYQVGNNLPVTGVLDPQTQAHMNPQPVTPQNPQPADSQVDELKRLLAEILRQIALLTV